MNRKKLREYPSSVVSIATATILTAAGLFVISGNAARMPEYNEIIENYEVKKPDVCELALMRNMSTAGKEDTYDSESEKPVLYAEDRKMLAQIAMAEAEGEGVIGKAMVMRVVLNRTQSDKFPNTVEEVIFQPKQFSPVVEGGRYYTTEPDEECYEALRLVEDGWDESYEALYFESFKGSSWHSENLEFIRQVGNHKFYR